MATTTTYASLRKPETSDRVNVTTDIAANMDLIDAWFAPVVGSTQAIGDSAAAGSNSTLSRSDHKHAMPAFASPVSIGTANASGSAATLPRSDHVHVIGSGAINSSGMFASGVVTSAAIADGTIVAADTDSSVARHVYLVNPGFESWQFGTQILNAAITAGVFTYVCDGWSIYKGVGSTVQVDRESSTVDTGSKYAMKVTYTHAATSALTQLIEVDEHLIGRTITISIRVKASVASAVQVESYDNGTRTYGSTHSGSGGWETLTVTATITSAVVAIEVFLSAGTGAVFYFDNAGLNEGSASGGSRLMLPSENLLHCLRYYYVIAADTSDDPFGGGNSYSTTSAEIIVPLPVPMRAVPSVSVSAAGDFNLQISSGGARSTVAVTSIAIKQATTTAVSLTVGVSSGLTAGDGVNLVAANTNAQLKFSAVL